MLESLLMLDCIAWTKWWIQTELKSLRNTNIKDITSSPHVKQIPVKQQSASIASARTWVLWRVSIEQNLRFHNICKSIFITGKVKQHLFLYMKLILFCLILAHMLSSICFSQDPLAFQSVHCTHSIAIRRALRKKSDMCEYLPLQSFSRKH